LSFTEIILYLETFVEKSNSNLVIEDDVVVSLVYQLVVDGEEVDSAGADEPLEFLQGHGEIIPGLESELYGMTVGQTKQVFVRADDAYGKMDPTALLEVPRADFPAEIPAVVGTILEVKDSDGEIRQARIREVTESQIILDFNHPLAGKDLQFEVSIINLREASPEELEHGHVHGVDYEEDDEDYEESAQEEEE
jgi:FKBP-type peptidyl-prolyl cis-trans isomerase SlyD